MTARVIALVEGPTEERFVSSLMAEHLGVSGVFITATTPGHRRTQGGVRPWPWTEGEIVGLLRQDADRHVTTMFDYYGMPDDWPGWEEARQSPHAEKANVVEQAMLDRIVQRFGSDGWKLRFIPYVQMHEFESLLFSDPEILGRIVRVARARTVTRKLKQIAERFATPEDIDDDPNKAPSKRILELASRYQKVTDGNIAAREIGLTKMSQKCPHFAGWLRRLRELGQPS